MNVVATKRNRKSVVNIVKNINRRNLSNNTQKVLWTLLTTSNKDGWVSRTSLTVPSASARVRDLRKSEFGGFAVECARPGDINRRVRNGTHQTFYRIVPSSVTPSALKTVFKGVVTD